MAREKSKNSAPGKFFYFFRFSKELGHHLGVVISNIQLVLWIFEIVKPGFQHLRGNGCQ